MVVEVQVGGLGGFWIQCWILWGTNGGLESSEATCQRFGRAWVGSRTAGDLDLGPTWVQLEASWRQLGTNMDST